MNEHSFAIAALAGIGAHGEPGDAPLARARLDSDSAEVRAAAAEALGRVGGEEDLSRLIELAQGRDGAVFARTALAISPPPDWVPLALLDTTRRPTALVAARHLGTRAAELDDATLDLMLHHTEVGVRRIGVAAALARAGDDTGALEALLDRYLSAESYYYSVVCLLDALLYGPSGLQQRTRKELEVFAAEGQPVSPSRGGWETLYEAALARRLRST